MVPQFAQGCPSTLVECQLIIEMKPSEPFTDIRWNTASRSAHLPAKIVVFMLWKRLYEISYIQRKLVRELPNLQVFEAGDFHVSFVQIVEIVMNVTIDKSVRNVRPQ